MNWMQVDNDITHLACASLKPLWTLTEDDIPGSKFESKSVKKKSTSYEEHFKIKSGKETTELTVKSGLLQKC